jgi:excinuclease ABC subunit B
LPPFWNTTATTCVPRPSIPAGAIQRRKSPDDRPHWTVLAAHRAAVGRDNESLYVTDEYIQELEAETLSAAESLEFERAGIIRDRISELKKQIGKEITDIEIKAAAQQKVKQTKAKTRGAAKVPRPKK